MVKKGSKLQRYLSKNIWNNDWFENKFSVRSFIPYVFSIQSLIVFIKSDAVISSEKTTTE